MKLLSLLGGYALTTIAIGIFVVTGLLLLGSAVVLAIQTYPLWSSLASPVPSTEISELPGQEN
jgi:hypothetical protein